MTQEHEHRSASEAQPPTQDQAEGAGSPELKSGLTPRIWIGSLADYNNGDLHGDWLDAARSPAEIYPDIQHILASGPAARRGEAPEEWGIFDHDEFGGLAIREYESIEDVSRLAAGVAAYGEAFGRWAELVGHDDATLEQFESSFIGHFESAADFAELLVHDLEGDRLRAVVPAWLQPYLGIDYAGLARDLELGGSIATSQAPNVGIYIYRQF